MHAMHVPRGSIRRLSYVRLSPSPTTIPIQRLAQGPTFDHTAYTPTRPESTSPRPSPKQYNDNPTTKSRPSKVDIPALDLKSLGIKGPVKIVVIVVVCVLATIETVFYVKVGLRWWNGEAKQRGEEPAEKAAKGVK